MYRKIAERGIAAGLKIVGLTAGLAWSSMALAIPQIEVGDIDAFVASTKLANAGDATEEAYVDGVLAPINATFVIKFDTNNGNGWSLVDGTTDVFAFWLKDYQPGYFLVKTGKNKGTSDREFLYQNLSAPGYAVIDLSAVGIDNVGKLSHITLFNTDAVTEVPEPASFALLGLALAGLGAFRRRQ